MLHIPMQPHTSFSIYSLLFSGPKSDHNIDPSHDKLFYEEDPKLGNCENVWSLSSE